MPNETVPILKHTPLSAFTPGPWRVIAETDVLALEGTPDAIVVASTRFFAGKPTEAQVADAQLIAAAPETMALLRAVGEAIAAHENGEYVDWTYWLVRIYDQLAEAEGVVG